MRAIFILVIAVVAAITPVEVRRGSLVVVTVSQKGDFVIVGAESRNVHDNKPFNDKACKIISLGGDTVFFETGVAYIKITRGTVSVKTGLTWNSQSVARSVYERSKNRAADKLSIEWGQEAVRWFKVMPPQTLRGNATDGKIITGGFATFTNDGFPTIYNRTLYYSDAKKLLITAADGGDPSGRLGMFIGVSVELVKEFFEEKTKRAIDARVGRLSHGTESDEASQLVRNAIQFAIDNSTENDKVQLGGPIDIAIIHKNRTIEWFARKPECYAEDQK